MEYGLKATQNNNPAWHYKFLVLKAEVFVGRSKNNESLSILELPPPLALSSGEFAARRKAIQGRALCYLGKSAEAQLALREAEQLASQSAPELLAEVMCDDGQLSYKQKNYEAAGQYYRKALTLARQNNQPLMQATALGNLGRLSSRAEHYDEAIDSYTASLDIVRSIHARSMESAIFVNLGWNDLELGDYDKAIPLFTDAEKFFADEGMKQSREDSLANLGRIYFNQQNYPVSQNYYSSALAIARDLSNPDSEMECLDGLALIALAMGNLDQADDYNEEALGIARKGHGDAETLAITRKNGNEHAHELQSLLTKAKIDNARRNFSKAMPLLRQIIRNTKQKSLLWEAEAELANLYAAEPQIDLAESQFQKVLNILDKARSEIVQDEYKMTFSSRTAEFYSSYIRFLAARGKARRALQIAEFSRARTLQEGLEISGPKYPAEVQISNVQSFLKKRNQTILAYWLASDGSFLWAVTPTDVKLFRLPGRQEIDQKVEHYRKSLLGPEDASNVDRSGQELYRLLVQPAREMLPSGAGVIIIPYGNLNQLNFETLRVPGTPPHYWIEDVELENASSIALVARSKTNTLAGRQRLLLIGNPVQANDLYPALTHASDEIERVSGRFSGKTTTIQGKNATPSAYRLSRPEQFGYIHFVTHGTASDLSPLESAIILSQESDNSYKLYARDIIRTHLNADVVTVSACYGAKGKIYGEGLVGLVWAFMRAGAHHVIAGLWEVDDRFTPKLMDDFYSRMNDRKSPADALRSAKLAMIQSGSIYRRPYYWASLQLYTSS